MKKGFTLAEVLITLGIIGVVAAMTIPTLINAYQTSQYKTAYKKAYSELNQAFTAAQAADELEAPKGTGWGADHRPNFYVIRDKFKIAQICVPSNLGECWNLAGELFGKAYTSGLPSATYGAGSDSFIDTAGMQWAQTRSNTSVYAVDTNGLKTPNEYGKDRFAFRLLDKNGVSEATMDVPIRVMVFSDNDSNACHNNKCATTKTYFATSWLLK